LHARLDGNQIVLGRPENAVAALRRLGDSVPRTRSLVDELLAERRAAAANE
jgi:antitoxin PrlF